MILMISVGRALAVRISGGMYDPHGKKGRRHIVTQAAPSADKKAALDTYERLAREKLDVMKTALAMGYSENDIAALDQRLEKLIGREQLDRIARGEAPSVSADLTNLDLNEEIRKLKQIRAS